MQRLRESPDGAFVSKMLARQPELPDETVLDILTWCRHYSEDIDALWRLGQLSEKLAASAVAAEASAVVMVVLGKWLDPTSRPTPAVAMQITNILACMTSIRDWRLRNHTYAMLVRWLRHETGLEVASVSYADFVLRLVNLIGVLLARGDLDLTGDAEVLARVTRWAERCAPASLNAFGPLADWFAERAARA